MTTEAQNLIVYGDIISSTVPGSFAQYRDMAGRFKTARDTSTHSSMELYAKSDAWSEVGSIADPANGSITFSTTTSRLVRQTKKYCTFVPGRTQTFMLTGRLHGTAQTGATFRIGSFDDTADKTSGADVAEANGHFFEADNTTGTMVYNVVQRSSATGSVVETRVARSSWNISTVAAADFTAVQTFIIERNDVTRLGLVVDGVVVWVHMFSGPLSRLSLPIRYELDATAVVSGASTMTQLMSSASVENFDVTMTTQSRSNAGTIAAETMLLAVRGRAATSRVTIRPKKITAAVRALGAASIVTANVYVNATLTDTSFTTASFAEVSTVGTASGGRLVASQILGESPSEILLSGTELWNNLAGTAADSIAIVFAVAGEAGCVGAATIEWDELM